MRVRILVAMGLGSLAACPKSPEPTVASGTTPSSTASATASSTIEDASATEVGVANTAQSSAPEAGLAVADTNPETNDAQPDVTTDAAPKPKPKPKPKTFGDLPDTWTVSYAVSVPSKPYCKTWWATCGSLAHALEVATADKAGSCPSSVPMRCPHKAGMGGDMPFDELGCSESLQLAVTNGQRAAGKKDACCYASPPDCTPPWVGRVLAGDAGPIRATTLRRSDWIDGRLSIDAVVDPSMRRALAEHYRAVALGEHAAVASFAATSLALLSHGAPPDLVAATHAAALDEVEHAKIAFAIAAAFGGEPIGPGRLTMPSMHAMELTALAIATLREACIPETIGAIVAREAAAGVVDPTLRAALERIAADEARHAELAFRTLAWLVREGGAAASEAVRDALASAKMPNPTPTSEMGSFGVLGPARERAIAEAAWSEVVVPCVTALLEVTPPLA